MARRVLFIHYTPPGVIGGVEHIIHQHLQLLNERGYQTEVVAGRQGETGVRTHILPEIDAAREESLRIENELAAQTVSIRFQRARKTILEKLRPIVAQADKVIAHNAFTLHFSMPLTAALWQLAAGRPRGSTIAWCHDLAWTNPLYRPTMYPGYPWDMLRTPAPGTQYVAISEERRTELLRIWGGPDEVKVVPNGVDVDGFLRLSPTARDIARRFRLYERDAVLLLPVRITRRKNIQAGIRAMRALKDRGLDAIFLVSGPLAPHHPGRSDAYLTRLQALAEELGVTDSVVFIADVLGRNLEDIEVSELYGLADALLFPSSSEGFGLPILEAGVTRLPVVASHIPIFQEVAGDDAWTFDPEGEGESIAEQVVRALDSRPARLYRRVLREYRWDVIVDRSIIPLLQTESP